MEVNYERMLQLSNQMKNYIQSDVGEYSEDTLSWKANEKKWSVLQVIEHLNMVYDLYLDNLGKLISGAKNSTESQQKQTTWIASLAVYTNRPRKKKVKYKVKTFSFFTPLNDKKAKNDIISAFFEKKDRFNMLLKTARGKNLTDVKVATALGKNVKFFVPQCMEFILAHEERHMVQIEHTLQMANSQ